MYYITNQNNQIIAIDPSLLALLEVENIDELYRKIALEDIVFSSFEDKVTIVTPLNEESYTVQKSELSGILGNLILIQVQASPEKPLLLDDDISTFTLAENNEELSTIEDENEDALDDISTFILEESDEEPSVIEDEDTLDNISTFTLEENDAKPFAIEDEDEDTLIEDLLNLDLDTDEKISLPNDDLISISDTDDLFDNNTFILDDLKEEAQKEITEKEKISLLTDDSVDNKESKEDSVTEENDDVLFDLVLPNAPDNAIDEISIDEVPVEEKDTSPICIDIENISQKIGISTKDYNIFLNEYIDTALSLEKDLLGTQEEKYSNAINTLSHLSNVLHLPVLSEIVTQIEIATAENQNKYIESFYMTLARLTTTQEDITEESPLPVPETDTTYEEEPLLVPETESITVDTESFGTISLDDVQSIHFDFQLEEASKDLALPVELIEEFVLDFIDQAHDETKKMLEAYEKGDLETIQQIGHLLKGASSNLRIKALSDTLYEIQFCQDSTKLEDLIKQYWGHFLSLETQMNLTSNTRK